MVESSLVDLAVMLTALTLVLLVIMFMISWVRSEITKLKEAVEDNHKVDLLNSFDAQVAVLEAKYIGCKNTNDPRDQLQLCRLACLLFQRASLTVAVEKREEYVREGIRWFQMAGGQPTHFGTNEEALTALSERVEAYRSSIVKKTFVG